MRRLGPALTASALLHAAAASAMLWPYAHAGAGAIEVELVELPEPSTAGNDGAALVAEPPSAMQATPDVDEVSALAAERDVLAARLEAEEHERAHLDQIVAALTAETRALAEERRRTALREQAQAERLAAERAMHEELLTALRREIAEKNVELRRSGAGLAVSIVDRVLFPSGRASLTAEGRAVIDKVARILTNGPERRLVVEGHTDNVPIGPDLAERFPSNWELSAARATEVVRALVARGVPPGTLEAVGRADTRPAASNTTEDGRRRNRRIEIVVRDAGPGIDATIGEGPS